MNAPQLKRLARNAIIYAGIVGITLILVDGICIAFSLFPPSPNYGDSALGWRPARATGAARIDQCVERSTGDTIRYERNEDGVRTARTREALKADTVSIRIGVTGDSQTDLCSTNAQLHSGVLEATLESSGAPAVVLPYGSGRYSPLQDYLAFREVLLPYGPRVLILNFYTGNDFYDILRADDRPHLAKVDSGYVLAPPRWYTLDDPLSKPRSRVAFAARTFADRIGLRGLYFRVSELRRLGAEQGAGISTVIAYMRDLLKARDPSLGYPDAFTAQFLNQQLFFHHFPGSQEESLNRINALMKLIREANPGLLLVMSPLPSYELVGELPVDAALLQTLQRLPITYIEGVHQEEELYERLRNLATANGWLFVDNLASLKASRAPGRLFNDFDYHFLPLASDIIGQAQSAVIRPVICAMEVECHSMAGVPGN